MWIICTQAEYPWKNVQNDILFALQYLQKCLEQHRIGWIFDPECNLWSHIPTKEFKIMADFVGRALKDLKNDDEIAWKYYFGKK